MKDRFKRFNSGRAVLFLVALIAVFLGGAVLKITGAFILPFTLALLLALVMTPFVNFLVKFKIPRAVSIIFAGVLVIAAVTATGAMVFSTVRSILQVFPRYETRLTEIYVWLSQFFDLSYDEELSVFQNLWSQLAIRSRIQLYTFTVTNAFVSFLRDAVMVTLFLVFMLFEGVFIKEKLSVAFENQWAGQIGRISTDIMQQISRYLTVKFIISVFNGVIVGFLLRLVGVEFAEVWGILQFVLNFIPTLGSITIGVVVSFFSLIQFWPEPGPIIWTVIIMLGTNMVIGNVLDPKIMGDRLGISPIAILLSLVIWGYIWGFAGMVIAVPMMVIIKIICENVSVLEPISVILSSRRAMQAKKVQYEKDAQQEEEEERNGHGVTGE